MRKYQKQLQDILKNMKEEKYKKSKEGEEQTKVPKPEDDTEK